MNQKLSLNRFYTNPKATLNKPQINLQPTTENFKQTLNTSN